MYLSVIGQGYVGLVTAVCLAGLGHRVTAQDTSEERILALQNGLCPLMEPDLAARLASAPVRKQLTFVHQGGLPEDADVHFICVGTPWASAGLDHGPVAAVLSDLFAMAARRGRPVLAAIRSTVDVLAVESILENLKRQYPAARVVLVQNPEFLREASAIQDFLNPPFIIAGSYTGEEGVDRVLEAFQPIPGSRFRTTARGAAMLKLACNAFHATKVAFANEVAHACDWAGIPAEEVFDMFIQDHSLNCSEKYLRPGFAFGGSCLPKDLRALIGLLERTGTGALLLRGVLASNDGVIEQMCGRIVAAGVSRPALLGLTFKTGTADLRDSPYLRLAQQLVDQCLSLRIFDPDLGRETLPRTLADSPRVHLCVSPQEALAGADSIILAKLPAGLQEELQQRREQGHPVFDLERRLVPVPSDRSTTAA